MVIAADYIWVLIFQTGSPWSVDSLPHLFRRQGCSQGQSSSGLSPVASLGLCRSAFFKQVDVLFRVATETGGRLGGAEYIDEAHLLLCIFDCDGRAARGPAELGLELLY